MTAGDAAASAAMTEALGLLLRSSGWLAPALARLRPLPVEGLARPGTDGVHFLYDPAWLAENPRAGAEALAHCTAHCLLGHLRPGRVDALAADLSASMLVDLLLPDFCPARGYEAFRQARHRLARTPLEDIPRALSEDPWFAERREPLQDAVRLDDHRLWTPEPALPARASDASGGWDVLARKVLSAAHARRMGRAPGDESRPYRPGQAPDRAWKPLLSCYARFREELREDPDAFEPGLYAHGLSLYGNLPLIEPSETREAARLDELAIVIDTSGSCLEDLTARFLDEVRGLLQDDALFARRLNLRVLQCDAAVRRDDLITDAPAFERYLRDLRLVGGGGTDFRPAFERIDRLIARGAFRRLPLALFFSDGMGLFPSAPPAYDVLFVGYRGRCDDIDLPHWARRLTLDEP